MSKSSLAILVAALGYLVDIYDLVLFSIVRVQSLKDLGFSGDELLTNGVFLLNCQMIGMLIGGMGFGVIGDKKGRIQVLFASILVYSLANLANAFVTDLWGYAVLRFIAGVGLAGEIGAGITLVAELLPKDKRGIGTTIVATVGVFGAVIAGVVGEILPWRLAYFLGGIMGLALLFVRVGICESGIYANSKKNTEIDLGSLRLLFGSWSRIKRYLACIFVGLPVWFVVGILVTFSPEIGSSLGLSEPLKGSYAIIYCYLGITLGDLASGLLSQFLRSRRKVLGIFMFLTAIVSLLLLEIPFASSKIYYFGLFFAGFFAGYWAVFITTSAEQFGTNLRATVTTSVPNMVRGLVALMTSTFVLLKPNFGIATSAQLICISLTLLGFIALSALRETFFTDLEYHEE